MATKNNWFTTNLKDRSANNLCDFEVNIRPYNFTKTTFNEAANRVANELVECYDDLYLTYSGGIDSEFVLKTFYELKLPITPIIVLTPYNIMESRYALDYCRERKIRYEVLTYTKEELLPKLYDKTCKRGWFSLLGGLPLIVCDEVNNVGGKLVTGYGEPFATTREIDTNPLETNLELCEWDFYLDAYDSTHPSGFFTYDLGLFQSLVNSIQYGKPTQQAKYELYGLKSRPKMFWDQEFYEIFSSVKCSVDKFDSFIKKDNFDDLVDKYAIGENYGNTNTNNH